MRTYGLLRVSSTLVLASCVGFTACGGGGDDDDDPESGGSSTVVVNESQFDVTGVSTLSSHLISPPSSTGFISFVFGPATPPIGEGSGQWNIGADGNTGEEMRFEILDGIALADVTRLGFWTYIANGSGVQCVNLSLRVDWNDDGIEDDRIFFEPEYQNGYSATIPDQADLALTTWQQWDGLAGGWWSNNDINFTPGIGVGTLADYIAAHPSATVVTHTDGSGGTRLNAGYGTPVWDNFVGNADALEVGVDGNVTTFDLDPE